MIKQIQIFIFTLFAFLLLQPQTVFAQSEHLPCFAEYPAQVYQGETAALALSSDPNAERFHSQLAQAAQQKPNFAGHYILTSWGCGAFCQTISIVDAQTGKVYFPTPMSIDKKYLVGWSVDRFVPNSKLLLLVAQFTSIPRDQPSALDGPFHNAILYYKWENNHLVFLQKYLKD